MTNLPEAILTLIKESASPIDTFTGVVEKMHKYRFKEPILYRGLTKIAIDLLGEKFILDTYLEKASLKDINNAQWCWYKEASQKLTRNELLEYVLMEDFPEFLKKASWEVGEVLRNIQGILKESSIKELSLDVRAKQGELLPLSPHILMHQRGAASPKTKKILAKTANATMGYGGSAAKSPSLGAKIGAGIPAVGASMPNLGGMRSGMMRSMGGPGGAGGQKMGY